MYMPLWCHQRQWSIYYPSKHSTPVGVGEIAILFHEGVNESFYDDTWEMRHWLQVLLQAMCVHTMWRVRCKAAMMCTWGIVLWCLMGCRWWWKNCHCHRPYVCHHWIVTSDVRAKMGHTLVFISYVDFYRGPYRPDSWQRSWVLSCRRGIAVPLQKLGGKRNHMIPVDSCRKTQPRSWLQALKVNLQKYHGVKSSRSREVVVVVLCPNVDL